MFQLLTPATVKLMHINVRTEKHGPADVDACDLDFVISGENQKVLALLHPKLCAALYFNAEAEAGQEHFETVPEHLPDLRFAKLSEALPWSDEATGVDLTVIYGLGDDASNIKLEGGKSATKRFEVEQGGTASVAFRYSVAGYPDGVIDKLRKKLKQEVSITMVRPEKLRDDAVIDGTVGHAGLAASKAADGQGSLLDDSADRGPRDDGLGTFADDMARGIGDTGGDLDDDGSGHADSGAAEQAELEAGMRESLAAAGVREKKARAAKVH